MNKEEKQLDFNHMADVFDKYGKKFYDLPVEAKVDMDKSDRVMPI